MVEVGRIGESTAPVAGEAIRSLVELAENCGQPRSAHADRSSERDQE